MSWMFLVLIYGLLKGAREVIKKKSLEISSTAEVLFFYTFIGFLFLLPETRNCLNFDYALIPLILIKAVCVCSAWVLSFNVIKKMSVGLYGILDMSRVLFAYIMGVVILGESLTVYKMVGMPLVVLGLFMLRIVKDNKGEKEDIDPLTVVYAIGSCLLNAISGILDKIIMRRNITSGQLQFWYMLLLVLFYGGFILFTKAKVDFKTLKKNYWIVILALMFIVADRCLFIANGNPQSQVTVMTLIKQSSCFVTIILGKLVYKEKNLRKKLICAAVIFAGIVIGSLGNVNANAADKDGYFDAGEPSQSFHIKDGVEEAPEEDYDKDALKIDAEKHREALVEESSEVGADYIDETLFIGDSNTVRMMNYEFTTLNNTLAVTGMGIQSVESLKCIEFEGYKEPVTIIDAVKIMQPRRIIITFGTNNASGMDVKSFINKYRQTLNSIHEAYPYADIIINSVPPFHKVNSYPALKMSVIDQYNMALCELADELKYKFLDTASVLKDPESGYAGDAYTVNDGIHITKAGFEAMFHYIRTHSYITEDTRPKPLNDVPKQKGTVYVISNDGKISHDPKAFGDMSDKDSKVDLEAIQATIEANAALQQKLEAEKKAEEEKLLEEKRLLEEQANANKHEHKSDDGTIEREATYMEPGEKIFRCTECGEEIRREEIPKLVKKENPKKEEKTDEDSEDKSDDKKDTEKPVDTEKTEPAEPEKPVDDKTPEPAEPEKPVDPEKPAPADPEKPVDSEKPAPAEPEKPVDVDKPEPTESEKPANPESPAPAESEAPAETDNSVPAEGESAANV